MPLDPNPISQPVSLPNWSLFKVEMFLNPAYRRVTGAVTNPLTISRIEMFFGILGKDYQLIIEMWRLMLLECPDESKPSAAEASEWANIANDCFMPLSFDAEGLLILAE